MNKPNMLTVIKRSGRKVPINYHKITQRIAALVVMEPSLNSDFVDASRVAQKVIAGLYDGVSTVDIDKLAAEVSGSMIVQHPDYEKLASRITVSNLHKSTPSTFIEAVGILFNNIDQRTLEKAPMVNERIVVLSKKYEEEINQMINNCEMDYDYSYFGMMTLIKSYLLKSGKEIIERPQYMLMRVALGIWDDNIDQVRSTYNFLSQKLFTQATPTLFHAGTLRQQLSSCFLIAQKEDSLEGIMSTAKDTAWISALSGGVGIEFHSLRAKGSYIKGSGGESNGLLPALKTYNELAKWWDQGGGKRKGSFAIYIEPWHADIFTVLDIRKNTGKEEQRARDLFTALWIPDLFMKRVKNNEDWTLMCPNECPGLYNCHGEEFEKLYTKYESEGRGKKIIKAQELWKHIMIAQIETGNPYMLYKDAANLKSNQQNLGTIKSSNLCTEIIEYTAPDEIAVCNLGSIALPKFVDIETKEFDHNKLFEAAYQLTLNLNRIIDINYYPVEEAKNSNLRHRPVGLGVQGLADAFILMRFPFDSAEAKQLNKEIFETIYYAAVTASKDLAIKEGPYSTFKGSPMSKGKFQFDLWNVKPTSRWEWDVLRGEVKKHGVRNSLLVAPMPTASTAQILGNNECFEPYTSNIYTRRVLSGEFIIVNKHLLKDLVELGLWNNVMKNKLMAENGSIQNINEIPQNIKDLYKTVWEISQKVIIDMSADRGAFICQSQSLNIFMKDPNIAKLSSMHFYGWEKGLKTGMYYLRTKSATDAVKFTLDKTEEEQISCSLDDPENCEMCSG